MAEIRLEHKKRSAWPWILALLALLLLGWLLWEWMDRDDPAGLATDTVVLDPTTTAPVTDTTATTATSGELQAFMSRCSVAEGSVPQSAGLEHEWSRDCLNLLANSISEVATQRQAGTEITQQVTSIRQQVDGIRTSDTASLQHSNQTRQAAMSAADALGSMHRAYASTNQQVQTSVDNARAAAQQIQPTVALLEQKDALARFFREAGNALQGMSAAPVM